MIQTHIIDESKNSEGPSMLWRVPKMDREEENPINEFDLPEIDPDEEETWAAEQEYERIKKERK